MPDTGVSEMSAKSCSGTYHDHLTCPVSLHSSEVRPNLLHAVESAQLRGNNPSLRLRPMVTSISLPDDARPRA